MQRALPILVLLLALAFFFVSERFGWLKGDQGENAPQVINLWAAAIPAQTMAELKSEFEDLYPQYQVEIQTVSWKSLQEKTLWAVAANSNVPDIIVGSSEWVGGLANNGALEILDNHFDEGFFQRYYPLTLGTYKFPEIDRDRPGWKGKLRQYGIPFDLDLMMVFYREDIIRPYLQRLLLDEFPDDWESFSDLGTLIYSDAMTSNTTLNLTYLDPEDPVPMRMAFLPSAGETLFNSSYTQVNLGSEKTLDAFQFFSRLINNGTARPWNRATQGDPIELIRSDKIAANITGPWYCKVLEERVPQQAGKWRVTLFPRQAPHLPTSGIGGSCLVIPYNAPNKPGAVALARYMSTDQFAMAYFKRVGSPPPLIEVWRNPVFEDSLPYFGGQKVYQTVKKALMESKPLELMPNAEIVRDHVRWALYQISMKNGDAKEILQTAAKFANQTLEESN